MGVKLLTEQHLTSHMVFHCHQKYKGVEKRYGTDKRHVCDTHTEMTFGLLFGVDGVSGSGRMSESLYRDHIIEPRHLISNNVSF